MKKLLAILMSFQFIVAPVMVPEISWADDEEERIRRETEKLAEETKAKAADAAKAQSVDTYREGGSDKDKGSDFYAKQVLALATSCIGSNILINCVMGASQPSIYAFMTGSLVHIGHEIFAAEELNKTHERKAKKLKLMKEQLEKAAGDGSLQKESINLMLDEEKRTRDFVRSRKRWMTAIAAVYWASVAMSIAEIWLEIPPPFGAGKPSVAGCTGNVAPALLVGLTISAAYGFAASQTDDSLVVKIGAPIAALSSVIKTVGQGLSHSYNHAIPRAITFGVAAGLATWIAVELGKKEAVLEKNIDKLNDVLAKMNDDDKKDEGGPSIAIGNGSSGSGNGPNMAGGNYGSTSEAQALDAKGSCLSSGPKGVTSSKDCSRPIRLSPPQMAPGSFSPEVLAVSQAGTDLGNHVASGDFGKANAAVGSLAAKAGRMRAIADDMMKKVNGKLKEAGQKEVDFKGEMNKQMAALIQDYNKGASGVNGAALASSSNSRATLDTEVPVTKESGPTGALGSQASTKPAAAPAPMDFGFSSDSSEAPVAPSPAPSSGSLSDSLSQFESNENDINKRPEVSLFDLISNRYVLNYERVMKRKERPKAEAPTVP